MKIGYDGEAEFESLEQAIGPQSIVCHTTTMELGIWLCMFHQSQIANGDLILDSIAHVLDSTVISKGFNLISQHFTWSAAMTVRNKYSRPPAYHLDSCKHSLSSIKWRISPRAREKAKSAQIPICALTQFPRVGPAE